MKRTNWKNVALSLRETAQHLERQISSQLDLIGKLTTEIQQLRSRADSADATTIATENGVQERIRKALAEQEREMSRLTDRINSDAAFIEKRRNEFMYVKCVASEFRSLIIDALHDRGGGTFATTDQLAAEFDKRASA
jgi:predicted RNase H-like nuclease (RuvC/YqgF family)